MTGVDADLATGVREALGALHRMSESAGEHGLYANEAALHHVYTAIDESWAAVEAELSRLREQRDALDRERDAGWRTMVEQRERAEAVEARCAELAEQGRIAAKRYGEEVERCARLQKALAALAAETEPEQHRGTEPHPERGMCVWCDARAALAGPDTPREEA